MPMSGVATTVDGKRRGRVRIGGFLLDGLRGLLGVVSEDAFCSSPLVDPLVIPEGD